MQTELSREQIKEIIMTELPKIVQTDQEVFSFIIKVTKNRYADKEETGDRIDRILDELKQDREKQDKKWEAQEKRWEEERKEDAAKWEAQEKKWEENQKVINEMLTSIKKLSNKYDSTIGAVGTRWGIGSETAFRMGLESILKDSFGVKVERYQKFDHEGKVFGQPDQVELDIIVRNHTLIICEIKSSMSKYDVYAFWRKKEFYETDLGRKADRVMVISPMIDKYAFAVAQKLGIEVFRYADDATL